MPPSQLDESSIPAAEARFERSHHADTHAGGYRPKRLDLWKLPIAVGVSIVANSMAHIRKKAKVSSYS